MRNKTRCRSLMLAIFLRLWNLIRAPPGQGWVAGLCLLDERTKSRIQEFSPHLKLRRCPQTGRLVRVEKSAAPSVKHGRIDPIDTVLPFAQPLGANKTLRVRLQGSAILVLTLKAYASLYPCCGWRGLRVTEKAGGSGNNRLPVSSLSVAG